jgi:hypothetical protein
VKLTWLLFAITPLFAEMRIYLKDLKVEHDQFSTENGGLFFFDEIQLQAKNIHYNRANETLEADTDLIFLLSNQLFAAKSLYIDLRTKTGWFEDLFTKVKILYIKSKKVNLTNTSSLDFDALEMTPFDQPPYPFSFQVLHGSIDSDRNLEARSISAQLFSAPVFYLSRFRWNLDEVPSHAVRYRFQFNTRQNPVVSFRYPIIADATNNALFRFDYRIGKGFTSVGETHSQANNHRLSLKTKNYISYDTFYNDNDPQALILRYRLQGELLAFPKEDPLSLKFTYDLNSDRNLRQNFFSEQFEILDVKRTEGLFGVNTPFSQNLLAFRPRANSYQSFSQQLPSLKIRLDPIEIPKTNLLFKNNFDFSYLTYSFSKNLYNSVLPFESARLQTTQKLDWPMQLGFLKIEPDATFSAIYYSSTPQNAMRTLVYGNLGVQASLILESCDVNWRHTIQPYVDFHALTRPNIPTYDRYIFSLRDGLFPIQELKTGILNTLYIKGIDSTCTLDLFGLNFFSQNTFNVAFPKLKSFFTLDTPWCTFKNGFGYNFQKNSIDLLTFEWGWTFRRDFAFHLDWLYRGPYEWKKDDRENYQLDMAYPIDTLALTPLSDKRNTFISRLEWHFFPNWTVRFGHHNGFWRTTEPPYFECVAEISTIWRSVFDVRLSFLRSVNDSQVLFSLNLID